MQRPYGSRGVGANFCGMLRKRDSPLLGFGYDGVVYPSAKAV
ncbi:hypothetical protein [Dapis sp. BLCC M172]